MPSTHLILTIANSLGLAYLIFLFYKKTGNKAKFSSSSSDINQLLKKFDHCAQKINLVRFNPFNDVGGDQSFILVILDNSNSGVIITSLHNRNNTRIYAKQIKNGQENGATLSREEKIAVTKTIKIK